MTKEQTQPDLTDMASKAQALFMVNGAAGAKFERFLEMQDALLAETETFARHWFDRRHEATQTAIAALHDATPNGAADPAHAMRAMTDWQRGSLARMMADMQEWTAVCVRCAGAMTTTPLDTAAADTDQAGSDKANGHADAKAKASHATPV